ncbi:Uncharacterized protein HZ326_1661 [Fusarium oxysporum f. sp. albedinis]|nr:Uncharacterized protein HZ326_1661 [Fusarium oxysporum f. sp. albedinis]
MGLVHRHNHRHSRNHGHGHGHKHSHHHGHHRHHHRESIRQLYHPCKWCPVETNSGAARVMDKSEVRSLCRGWSIKEEKCQGLELT